MGGTTRKPTTTKPKARRSTPIEETWQHILGQAFVAEASDIHVEPGTDKLVIRYRRHGLLSSPEKLSKALAQPLARYLKTRAQLDARQTRAPQAGNFAETHAQRRYDLSLATMPLLGGERLVIHLHDPLAAPPTLTSLGLWGNGLTQVQQALAQPHGLILVSSPNHNGLSITLASLAANVVHPAHLVASVEAEVAYHVPTVAYMSVQPNTGMTWQRALKLQLKHEPDVVLLGLMSNRETAELAIAAAQRQQLILAGVPASDQADGITQIARLSGNALMLAATLHLITNQRLAWHLCANCRESYAPDIALQQELYRLLRLRGASAMKRLHELELLAIKQGLPSADHEPSTNEHGILRLWRAKAGGCQLCHGSGYTGAVVLISVLPIDDQLRSRIARSASLATLRAAVRDSGALSLQLDGCIKALRGLIAIESVLNL